MHYTGLLSVRALKHSTENQNRFNYHRFELFAHVFLGLDSQFSKTDCQTTGEVIIFGMDKCISKRKVVFFILVTESFGLLGGIINNDSLSSIRTIFQDDSFSHNLRARFFFFSSHFRAFSCLIFVLRVDRKRAYVTLDCAKCLINFFLINGILTNNPKCYSNYEVRFNFSKASANLAEDSFSVLRVSFNDFSDEKDSFKRCES